MSEQPDTQSVITDTTHLSDLYFVFQHEKLGTFKAAQKLQEIYRTGELKAGLGDVARLLLTFDQRRALRYTARERVIAYRKVFGYNLFIRPTGAQGERNRAFHRLFVSLASAIARDSAQAQQAANALLENLTPLLEWDLAPLCAELITPLNQAIHIFMSPELCAEFGANSGWELVDLVLQRYYNEKQTQTLARSRLAAAGRALLSDLAQTPRDVAVAWLESAGQLNVLPK